MARWEPEQTVTQSVLERLIDRDPKSGSEGAPTRAQSVRLLRASVRRDLEWLLNTRRTPAAADEAYPEVAKSVYNYGLPDLNATQVIQRLLEPGRGLDAEVIVVTGGMPETAAEELRRMGVKTIVNKVEGIAAVVEAMRQVLRERKVA